MYCIFQFVSEYVVGYNCNVVLCEYCILMCTMDVLTGKVCMDLFVYNCIFYF